jgi:hypothetical protein
MFITQKVVFFAIFIFLIPSAGSASNVTIGSDSISLSIPNGYCSLNNTDPSDDRLIKYFEDSNKGLNKVISVFGDCDQLKAWRLGDMSTLNDYGYVLTPSVFVNKKLNISINSYLAEMTKVFKKKGQKILDRSIDDNKVILKDHMPLVKLNETKNLGIISQDEHALYMGILQNLQTEEGKSKKMVGVYAATLVNKKSVYLYLFKKHQGNRTIYDLETLISAWVLSVQKKN